MKKFIFLITTIISWGGIAQTTLKPSYYVDTKSDAFKHGIVEIKEYVNYEQYQQLQLLMKKGNVGNISNEMMQQAYVSKRASLQKGKYIIDNDEHQFEFEVGNGGLLIGEGKYLNKKRNIASTYIFNNGRLAEIHLFTPEGRLRKKNVFKGNLIEGFVYNHEGNIVQKIEIHTNLKEGSDQVVTTYHKNGNVSKIEDHIKKTTKEYYQSGKPKMELIESKSAVKYDPEGNIVEKWYINDKGNCKEIYEKGVITLKNCESRGLQGIKISNYYYKNGQLEYYTITDGKTNKTQKYDSNNNPIN